jgi:hypothetical protein
LKLSISLDYDDTYTADPDFWHAFIDLAKSFGHKIVCVTARGEHHGAPGLEGVIDVCYTNGKLKCQEADDQGHYIHIWIDDSPHLIGKLDL